MKKLPVVGSQLSVTGKIGLLLLTTDHLDGFYETEEG